MRKATARRSGYRLVGWERMRVKRTSMRIALSILFMAGAIFPSGCGSDSAASAVSQGPLPPGYVAPAASDHLPLVDHPEYANWSKFPVGISIVRKKEVSNEFGSVR